MKPVDLDQLIPQESKVKLGDKKYTLRKINLDDEIWVKATFGNAVDKIFVEQNFEAISKIAFRLLEDKTDFAGGEETQIDDDGFPKKCRVSGPEKIRRLISGPKEKVDFLWAVFKTFGISRPEPSEDVEPKKA